MGVAGEELERAVNDVFFTVNQGGGIFFVNRGHYRKGNVSVDGWVGFVNKLHQYTVGVFV